MASSHVARITAGGVSDRRIAHSLYGYCTTAAATAAKTVSLYTGSGTTADGTWAAADLFHGLTIKVRFQYSNTASSPTLNVNGTGAKSIYRYGTTVPGTTVITSWQAQEVVTFTYDTLLNTSGCWVMGRGYNVDTQPPQYIQDGSSYGSIRTTNADGTTGQHAFAQGSGTASGNYSVALNLGTLAASTAQLAVGKYNVQDSTNTYAVIVGNGTGTSARSNAFTLDWQGNSHFTGAATFGSASTTSIGGIISVICPVEDKTVIPASSYGENIATHGVVVKDKLGQTLGRIDGYIYYADSPYAGYAGTRIGTVRSVNGSSVGNYLYMAIDESGNFHVGVTSPLAWRKTLNFVSEVTGYTPTISASSGTNPTVANVSFRHWRVGNILVVSGRFQMSAVGSIGSSAIMRISYPSISDVTFADLNVGSAGMITVPGSETKNIALRNNTGGYFSVVTSSGANPTLSTGYYMILGFIPIST